MKKIPFKLDEAYSTPQSVALTKSILMPITVKAVGEGQPLWVYHDKLRQMSWARTRDLWGHHPEVFQTKTDTPEAAEHLRDLVGNCKVFGGRTSPVGRYTCGRPKLCPYCWARKVTLKAFWPLWNHKRKGLKVATGQFVFPIAGLEPDVINCFRQICVAPFTDAAQGVLTVTTPVPATDKLLRKLPKEHREMTQDVGILLVRVTAIGDESLSEVKAKTDHLSRLSWVIRDLRDADDVHAATRSAGSYPAALTAGNLHQHAALLTRFQGAQLVRREGLFKQAKPEA